MTVGVLKANVHMSAPSAKHAADQSQQHTCEPEMTVCARAEKEAEKEKLRIEKEAARKEKEVPTDALPVHSSHLLGA